MARKRQFNPPWLAAYLKPTHKPGYLSPLQYERRLRQNAAIAEKEARQLVREAERLNKKTARDIAALRRSAKRTAKKTGTKVDKAVRNAIAKFKRVGARKTRQSIKATRQAEELRRRAPSTTLSPTERHGLQYALHIAADRHPGRDMPSGTYRFLAYQKPAVARQWISFYVHGEGEEPVWLDIEDIEDYYATE